MGIVARTRNVARTVYNRWTSCAPVRGFGACGGGTGGGGAHAPGKTLAAYASSAAAPPSDAERQPLREITKTLRAARSTAGVPARRLLRYTALALGAPPSLI